MTFFKAATEEQIAALKVTHGEGLTELTASDEATGLEVSLLVVMASRPAYNAYADGSAKEAGRDEARSNFVSACTVHPTQAEVQKLFGEMPALAEKFADALDAMASGDGAIVPLDVAKIAKPPVDNLLDGTKDTEALRLQAALIAAGCSLETLKGLLATYSRPGQLVAFEAAGRVLLFRAPKRSAFNACERRMAAGEVAEPLFNICLDSLLHPKGDASALASVCDVLPGFPMVVGLHLRRMGGADMVVRRRKM